MISSRATISLRVSDGGLFGLKNNRKSTATRPHAGMFKSAKGEYWLPCRGIETHKTSTATASDEPTNHRRAVQGIHSTTMSCRDPSAKDVLGGRRFRYSQAYQTIECPAFLESDEVGDSDLRQSSHSARSDTL